MEWQCTWVVVILLIIRWNTKCTNKWLLHKLTCRNKSTWCRSIVLKCLLLNCYHTDYFQGLLEEDRSSAMDDRWLALELVRLLAREPTMYVVCVHVQVCECVCVRWGGRKSKLQPCSDERRQLVYSHLTNWPIKKGAWTSIDFITEWKGQDRLETTCKIHSLTFSY